MIEFAVSCLKYVSYAHLYSTRPIKSDTMQNMSADNVCTGTDLNDETEVTVSASCRKSHKVAAESNTDVSLAGQVSSRQKKSTFLSHPWILRVTNGYICKLCSEYLRT